MNGMAEKVRNHQSLCAHIRNKCIEQNMDLQGQSTLPAAHLPGLRLHEAGANSL
jgi:hypothetical protein